MIIGTAGHIDHGKSALVEALTGRTVDRLAEERRRGITIDLNFAPLELRPEVVAGVVDVPGHEDLVRTMIAGASGMQLVLLVVAADAGLQPQTLEHLAVIEALRVSRGIPVLTKCDLVGNAVRAERIAALAERLARSPVRFEAPIAVSVRSGEGLQQLRTFLASFSPPTSVPDAFRMPVDRAFSIAGVGTVVTGTAWSGSVSVGDAVRLLPGGPESRVRSIEMYGRSASRSEPEARVALGLPDIPRDSAARGEWVVTDELPWRVTTALDAAIELDSGVPRPLAARSRVRVHLGTAEVMARVIAAAPIEAGGSGVVRLALEAPLLARGGDRIVLRSFSPVATIGGGAVLDPFPPPRSRIGDLEGGGSGELPGALIRRRRDGAGVAEMPLLLGMPPGGVDRVIKGMEGIRRLGEHLIAADRVLTLQRAIGVAVDGRHRDDPSAAGLSLETVRGSLNAPGWLVEAALDAEAKAGRVRIENGMVRRPDFRAAVPGGESAVDRLVDLVVAGGLTPPDVPELERLSGEREVAAALRIAAREGRVEGVGPDRFVASGALAEFGATLRDLGAVGPITVGALRERLGLSRKYLIPLLEWADRRGITERRGDVRVVLRPRA